MFAQSTHTVVASHKFACVGIYATEIHIHSFIKIFGATGGQNLAISLITIATGFYKILCCHTTIDFSKGISNILDW